MFLSHRPQMLTKSVSRDAARDCVASCYFEYTHAQFHAITTPLNKLAFGMHSHGEKETVLLLLRS